MKKTIQYIALTCAVSWVIAGVAVLLGLRVASGLAYTFFAAAYMLLPAVCAIILQAIYKEKLFGIIPSQTVYLVTPDLTI